MASKVKSLGENFDLLDGTGLFSTRFYTSLGEVWHGFSKSAFGAFGFSIFPYILTLAFAYFVFLHPFVMLILNPYLSFNNPFFNQVVIILALRLLVALKTRQSALFVLFHPLMILFALGFCLNSLSKILFRLPLTWKERSYKISK
jgi:hypothetical protein